MSAPKVFFVVLAVASILAGRIHGEMFVPALEPTSLLPSPTLLQTRLWTMCILLVRLATRRLSFSTLRSPSTWLHDIVSNSVQAESGSDSCDRALYAAHAHGTQPHDAHLHDPRSWNDSGSAMLLRYGGMNAGVSKSLRLFPSHLSHSSFLSRAATPSTVAPASRLASSSLLQPLLSAAQFVNGSYIVGGVPAASLPYLGTAVNACVDLAADNSTDAPCRDWVDDVVEPAGGLDDLVPRLPSASACFDLQLPWDEVCRCFGGLVPCERVLGGRGGGRMGGAPRRMPQRRRYVRSSGHRADAEFLPRSPCAGGACRSPAPSPTRASWCASSTTAPFRASSWIPWPTGASLKGRTKPKYPFAQALWSAEMLLRFPPATQLSTAFEWPFRMGYPVQLLRVAMPRPDSREALCSSL